MHNPWLPRIVAWHARLSLARKLTFLGVLTSVVSLVIAMTAVLAWDLSSARTRLVRDTGMLADVIGSNSKAAVAFGDAKAATDICARCGQRQHRVGRHLDEGRQ